MIYNHHETHRWVFVAAFLLLSLTALHVAAAVTPPGLVKSTFPVSAPPVGLAFDADGTLFALEAAPFGSNTATVRSFSSDGTPGTTFTIAGDDPNAFYSGGMAYDPVGDRLLISDNTADGRLYAVSKIGVKEDQPLATGLANLASIAVRPSGEIFVSTAPFGNPGAVLQVDRGTGMATQVLGGLGFGAGLTFDPGSLNDAGALIVQDAIQDLAMLPAFVTHGRLQKLPITEMGGLQFGEAQLILDGMSSGYSVAVDSEGDLFTTGTGGLFQVAGTPLAETSLIPTNFAGASAFDPGPFERFGGAGGGRLALAAEAAYSMEDLFVTILTPAEPGDYNGDGNVDAGDYAVWRGAFGTTDAYADGNRDGQVDAADYVLWRHHSQAEAASGVGGAAIPEPSSLLLMITQLLVLSARRRARASA